MINKNRIVLDDNSLLQSFDSERIKALKEYMLLLDQIKDFNPETDCYQIKENSGKVLSNNNNNIRIPEYSLAELLASVSLTYRIDPSLIISSIIKNRTVVSARRSFIYVARRYMNRTGKEIAEYFSTTQEAVAKNYQLVVMDKFPELKDLSDGIWNDMSNV